MSAVSKIAKKAAKQILPEHWHVEEDCWYSCPLHPDSCCSDKGDKCDCNLEGRRAAVAVVVQAAIDRALAAHDDADYARSMERFSHS